MATFPLLNRPRHRRIAFTIFVALTAAFFAVGFGAAASLLAPWSIITFGPSDPHPELHRWHSVQSGATFGILFAGSLVALLRQPQAKPVVAQFFVAGTIVLAAALVAFDAASLMLLSVGAQVAALYPQRRLLLANPWPSLRQIDPWRLVLALATVAILAPDAVRSLRSQIDGSGGEHASLNHWGLSFGLALLLVLAALLAASERPGARIMAMITGIALIYLGVAALAIPDHDGSWGIAGGTLATLGGLAYLATAYRDRLGTRAPSEAPPHAIAADGD